MAGRAVDKRCMRVLVCGGREFANRQMLDETLNRVHLERGITLIISGGARGADAMAEGWAKAEGVPCDVYQADWTGLGAKLVRSATSACWMRASPISW